MSHDQEVDGSVSCQDAAIRQRILQLAPLMANSLESTAEHVTRAMTEALTRLDEDAGVSGVTVSLTHTCRQSQPAVPIMLSPLYT